MLSPSAVSLSLLFVCLIGCTSPGSRSVSADRAVATVIPAGETQPVSDADDAADDPAIWVHPADPARSLILGTNKKSGLCVYNLAGEQAQFLSVGRVNNVDVRQGVTTRDGVRIDLAAASHRDAIGVSLFIIEPTAEGGSATELPGSPFRVTVGEPYGVCLARRAGEQGVRVFVNDKSGRIEEWRVEFGADRRPLVSLVRVRQLSSQVEGMVADEETGLLFVGEETVGIWSFPLDGPDATRATLIAGAGSKGPLVPDVEGLTIARTGVASGYLICSSQGNNTFVAFDRKPPHGFIGSFRIGGGAVSPGSVEETDGIDVCTARLGPLFPSGVFIAQDGVNPPVAQNFKMVSWPDIVAALAPAGPGGSTP